MKTNIPSEFAGFVRDAGVRAFDRLAARAKDLNAPMRSVLRSWSRLSAADKESLFDHLIDAARGEDSADVITPKKRKTAPKRKSSKKQPAK